VKCLHVLCCLCDVPLHILSLKKQHKKRNGGGTETVREGSHNSQSHERMKCDQDSEPRMTVQAKARRNLPETVTEELQEKEHVLQGVRVVLYGTTRIRIPSYLLHQTAEIEHISEIRWFSHYKTKTIAKLK
jgi:hypothetical protein